MKTVFAAKLTICLVLTALPDMAIDWRWVKPWVPDEVPIPDAAFLVAIADRALLWISRVSRQMG
jgi:hypothetical protein